MAKISLNQHAKHAAQTQVGVTSLMKTDAEKGDKINSRTNVNVSRGLRKQIHVLMSGTVEAPSTSPDRTYER